MKKRKKMIAGTFCLTLFLLPACTRTVYQPVVKSKILIDTVTQTVADSTVLKALFECDSIGNVRLKELSDTKGKMADMETRLKDGELKVVTRWQTKYIDRMVEVRDTVTMVEIREVIRQVKHIPKFFWGCFIVAFCALGLLIWKIARKFNR